MFGFVFQLKKKIIKKIECLVFTLALLECALCMLFFFSINSVLVMGWLLQALFILLLSSRT